ncbi:mCG147636 [Mus musculus]|nr:mCG147636 [Mus musculus]
MACTREEVAFHASPAEASREPGVSWSARGSSLRPAMHMDIQAVSCGLPWDSSSRMRFFFFLA